MDIVTTIALFSLISGALGVYISWIAFQRQRKKDSESDGKDRGYLASDIGYIKAGVDDLKRESRDTRSDVEHLAIDVARCEESCKQAHKRIDEVIESKRKE